MNTFHNAVAAAAVTPVHPARPAPASRSSHASHYERSDARSRDIVDHAITVQETANTMAAVEYLKSHDVAAHVIERVLLEPMRRRSALPA